ncbi:MAG: MarR family winged helix-turn-helix transcriptional regulator [Cellulomonas sp.]
MSEQQTPRRPIGWWLKEADARLDAAFDNSLADQGVDRRSWQVLATLAGSTITRAEVIAALGSFDAPATVDSVIDTLRDRAWVEETHGLLQLTTEGVRTQAALVPLVDEVRAQVTSALPGDDYTTLVRLLARLVAALPEPTG